MKSFLPSILREIPPQTSLEVEADTPRPLCCGSCGMSFRRAPCPENGKWTTCGMCLDHFWHADLDGVLVVGVVEH